MPKIENLQEYSNNVMREFYRTMGTYPPNEKYDKIQEASATKHFTNRTLEELTQDLLYYADCPIYCLIYNIYNQKLQEPTN